MMKKRRWFRLALLLFLLVGSIRAYYKLTDDFRLANIYSPIEPRPEWEIPSVSHQEWEKIDRVLKQSFHYLKKGAQAYAFVSDDGKWVLKFFKFKHLRPSFIVDNLPSISPFKEFRDAKRARKKRKVESVFIGYRLAYAMWKEESGLLWVHLNPTDHLKRQVVVYDKLGFKRTIALDEVPFVVQKKAEGMRAHIKQLMENGDVAAVKQTIQQVFKLYLKGYSRGIFDQDHGVMNNLGVAEGAPLHFDVGKLQRQEKMKDKSISKEDLTLVVNRFDEWFEGNYPENREQLYTFMEQELANTFCTP